MPGYTNSSPPPLSDDSALGSMASNNVINSESRQMDKQLGPAGDSHASNNHVHPPRELPKEKFDTHSIVSRSLRINLPHLDIQKYISQSSCWITFISKGTKNCSTLFPRPISILWPDSYETMFAELERLKIHLSDNHFINKPVEWMLNNGLTTKPNCHICHKEMTLVCENDTAKWICSRKCSDLFAIVRRPTCFKNYEHVGIMRILFMIYHWSICTPFDLLSEQLKLQPRDLQVVWRQLQRVCITALEKSYPRFRLYNNPEGKPGGTEPIDLIFIKFNNIYIVCAKHPRSSCVRLGKFHLHKIATLTQTWFAHGAQIRVCQSEFLDLKKLRTDLEIKLAPLSQMILKDGHLDVDSAFGYLIYLLTNTFKEFDSSTMTNNSIRHFLAEAEWRELYGKTPLEAFSNIVHHISQYCRSDTQTILSKSATNETRGLAQNADSQTDSEEEYVEKYFYATAEPLDSQGKVIRRYEEIKDPLSPDVMFLCHICNNRYESFDFSMHIIAHIESDLRGEERKIYSNRRLIECKHCFKPFDQEELSNHSALMRMDTQMMKFGCRICCIKFQDEINYLEHMTKFHFEHETPYRCPSCKFASSFQRELFIHFQEEHRQAYIILCPICLRSFTIIEPERLNTSLSRKASQLIHKHIHEHYIFANRYSCDSCCLCFLSKAKLQKHRANHHDPTEMRSKKEVYLQPFIVTREEEQYCTKTKLKYLRKAQKQSLALRRDTRRESEETESYSTYLDGHAPAPAPAPIPPSSNSGSARQISDLLTSEKIIKCLSKLKQTNTVLPNDSVVLAPSGLPAKCAECMEYITVYHYVSATGCELCPYVTHCPRALDNHQVAKHGFT